MKTSRLITPVGFLTLTLLLSLYPTELRSQGMQVNCDSGGTIRGALANLRPGDTLTVSGTCNEGVANENIVMSALARQGNCQNTHGPKRSGSDTRRRSSILEQGAGAERARSGQDDSCA